MKYRQFLWACIVQFVVVVLLFNLFGLAHEVYPTKINGRRTDQVWTHITLYVDRNIDEDHMIKIGSAASRWSSATNYIVKFTVTRINSNEIRTQAIRDPEAIVVTIVSEDYPDVIRMDVEENKIIMAYCDIYAKTPILAYVDTRIDEKDFEKITLHELGHALRLKNQIM